MPISPFVLDPAYFENIEARQETMNAADFDTQFAAVADFINSSVLPVVNQLIDDKVPGSVSPGDANKFLRNIGDGTVEWASIGQNAILDFSLAFSKLSKCTAGSILAAGANRVFKEVTPREAGQVLISQANNAPIWAKLRGNNVDDRQITTEKIALQTLTNENFQEGVLFTQLLDDSVTAEKIADLTIPTAKIADGAIDGDILGGLANQFTGVNFFIPLWPNTLPDGFINVVPYLGTNNNVINYRHISNGFKIPVAKLNTNNPVFNFSVADGAVASYQIAENTISGGRLYYINLGSGIPNRGDRDTTIIPVRDINDFLADGSIQPQHLPSNYRAILGL